MLMFWDEPKRERNIEAHSLDFADARERFEWDSSIIAPTYPGAEGRERFVAIGFLDDDLVTLVFSRLGSEAVSAISLRRASRKERKTYAQS